MPPGTIHSVVTINASIMHGSYFFNPRLMWQSFVAAVTYSAYADLSNDERDWEFVDLHTRTLRVWTTYYCNILQRKANAVCEPMLAPPDLKTGVGLKSYLGLVWLVIFAKELYPHRDHRRSHRDDQLRKVVLHQLSIFIQHWSQYGGASVCGNAGSEDAFNTSLLEAARLMSFARTRSGENESALDRYIKYVEHAVEECPALEAPSRYNIVARKPLGAVNLG